MPLKYVVDNPPEQVRSNSVAPDISSPYQALIDSNPYRNVDYTMSPWQKLLSKLGFRTQADAWKENMTVQANEYDAAIKQKEYDEQYNTPLQQVARMRAAGLNPDLDGGSSIDPGSAQAPGEDPSTPMQSTGEEGVIMSVANGVLSAFSDALGMVSSFQGIQRNNIENSLLSLSESSQVFQTAQSMAPYFLPDSPKSEGIDNFDWKGAALLNAQKYAGKHIPKKYQQAFIDAQTSFWDSAIGEGESYAQFADRIKNKRNWATEHQTLWSEFDDVLMVITEPLAEMNEKIFKQNQETELAESKAAEASAGTTESYQLTLDGSLMAETENASHRATKEKQETMSVLNETVNNIIQGLKEKSKEGGIKGGLASLALSGITMLQLWISSVGMPSIHSSQSSGGSSWTKFGGSASSSSSSFGIGF